MDGFSAQTPIDKDIELVVVCGRPHTERTMTHMSDDVDRLDNIRDDVVSIPNAGSTNDGGDARRTARRFSSGGRSTLPRRVDGGKVAILVEGPLC